MRRPAVAEATQVRGLFLLFGVAIAAFFPFLSLYLREYHGLDETEIGLVLLVVGVARTVGNPLWGHQADTRIGRLTALQLSVVGAGIAAIWLNLADGLTVVCVAAAVHAFFMVAHGSNVDAIALVHLGEDRMHEYGRIRGWESVTYAAGCLAIGGLLQAFGTGWAMPVYAVTMLLILGWSTTVPRDHGQPLEQRGRLGSVGAVFHEAPRFWLFLIALFLVWTGFNAAWNFISLRIDDAGGGPLLIGIGTALGGLMEVPMMRSSSRLQSRFGLRRVYIAGCLIYAGGFALWGAVNDATILSFLTLFEGVAFSLLFTTGVVVVGRLLPPHLYSTGSAVSAMVGFGLGPIVGGVAGGFVYQHVGAVYTYAGASVLALAGAVVAWFALSTPSLREPSPAEPAFVQPDGPLP
jgi:PPP family 3-phenylpropionic acid transporter